MHIPEFSELASVGDIEDGFDGLGYICSEKIATAVFLAARLGKPVLVEGPPGVGKTELAKTAAALLSLPLVRLQCYEGLDEAKALYEWKYGKQLLYTQVLKEQLGDRECATTQFFSGNQDFPGEAGRVGGEPA